MNLQSTQTQELIVVLSKPFYQILCDFYQSDQNDKEFFMTRNQIGEALGCSNPQKALSDIHKRHSRRLDRFSVIRNLRSTDGKSYNTTVYTLRGVMEICRYSRQPKADEFMDFVWDVMETLFRGEAILTPKPSLVDTAITQLQSDYIKISNYVHEHCYEIQSLIERVDRIENNKILPEKFSAVPSIKQLIHERGDQSPHGCATYHAVYMRMYDKRTWKRLISKYKHQHSVIKASKPMLVSDNPTIRELYNKTIQLMLEELEGR
jgi:hypothetical protein